MTEKCIQKKPDGPIQFYTKKVACIHRLTAGDVPRGLDPDDVTLECEDDPKCPERGKNDRK